MASVAAPVLPAPAVRADAPDAPDAPADLQHVARPLVSLAGALRDGSPADPAATLRALVQALQRFEADAAAAGHDAATVAAASYLLCVWVDEVVDQTPWGRDAGGAALLQRFHGEAPDGHRLLRLLARLAEQPQRHRDVLALWHTCLSLGLQAPWRGQPDAAARLETLRERLFAQLSRPGPTPDGGRGDALSPPLPRLLPQRRPQRRAWRWAAVVALGFVTLGVYAGLRVMLARQADAVFASIRSLEDSRGLAPVPVAGVSAGVRAAPPLSPALQADAAAGRLLVRDEVHRSTVSVPVDRLFEPGSARLTAHGAALLRGVAHALSQSARAGDATPMRLQLLVRASTDAAEPRSARWPSAWHQTMEWATQVAAVLQRELPAARIAVESAAAGGAAADGAVDGAADGARPAGLPARRADIVWFP